MSDLVARLHGIAAGQSNGWSADFLFEAAEHIEALEADLAAAKARENELRDDIAIWKGEAASRSQGMVELNLDRAAMGVENMKLRKALAQISERDGDGLHMLTPQAMQYIARAALAETGDPSDQPCLLCDGQGYKDHAALRLDPCECRKGNEADTTKEERG